MTSMLARYTVFIQANEKQLVGAELARFAILKHLAQPDALRVEIINMDGVAEFRAFAGARYLRNGVETVYDPRDLQSFTLSRFMAPELAGYRGRAVVIDPDVFALADLAPLLAWDLGDAPIAACPKKSHWDTSVMVLDCEQLPHWKLSQILSDLRAKRVDYLDWMALRLEKRVTPLSRTWNSLDHLDADTKMLHTTFRETQPWKTGLPIDFTRNPLPKLFGILPREPLHRLLGKRPNTYQPHPDKSIENFFFELAAEALRDGALDEKTVRAHVAAGNLRADFLERAAAFR